MKRIAMLMTLLALALTVTRVAAAPLFYELDYDFLTSVAPFQAGAVDMNTLTKETLLHEVEPTNGLTLVAPNGYAALSDANGAEAVYMMTVVAGVGQQLRLNFQAKDLQACGRCAVIAYVGASKPNPHNLSGFQKLGMLKTGWSAYTLQAPISTEYVVVAIGIMNLDMTRMTQRAGIDNVQIQFLDD